MCSPLRTIASPMGRDQKRPSSDRSFPTITVPKTLDFKGAEEDEVLNSKELFSPTLKFNDEDTKTDHSRQHICNEEEEHEDEEEENRRQEEESKEESDEFNPFFFIKSLPPYEDVVKNRIVPILLPKRTRRSHPVTLVLDLDETLVHCSIEPIDDADLQFEVNFGGLMYHVYVRKRPHLEQFLEVVSKQFEVLVFTASQRVYAEKLLNLIDPTRKFIKHRLYRDSCLDVCDNFLKDLNVLGRDLSKTIIVDNSPHAFGYQISNGIPIESWFEDKKDVELLNLLPVLDVGLTLSLYCYVCIIHNKTFESLHSRNFLTFIFLSQVLKSKDDVRPFIREYYQLHKLVEGSR